MIKDCFCYRLPNGGILYWDRDRNLWAAVWERDCEYWPDAIDKWYSSRTAAIKALEVTGG